MTTTAGTLRRLAQRAERLAADIAAARAELTADPTVPEWHEDLPVAVAELHDAASRVLAAAEALPRRRPQQRPTETAAEARLSAPANGSAELRDGGHAGAGTPAPAPSLSQPGSGSGVAPMTAVGAGAAPTDAGGRSDAAPAAARSEPTTLRPGPAVTPSAPAAARPSVLAPLRELWAPWTYPFGRLFGAIAEVVRRLRRRPAIA
jgi:hypothetical protein